MDNEMIFRKQELQEKNHSLKFKTSSSVYKERTQFIVTCDILWYRPLASSLPFSLQRFSLNAGLSFVLAVCVPFIFNYNVL